MGEDHIKFPIECISAALVNVLLNEFAILDQLLRTLV
jgi:hypothetical protein